MKSNTKDSITVYWAPSNFLIENESWILSYRNPEPLHYEIKPTKNKEDNKMFSCPAVKDSLKNVYVIKSNINDVHTLPVDYLNNTAYNKPDVPGEPVMTNGVISLRKYHQSSLEGYSLLSYNLSWNFFADQPLMAKFTAPYLPPTSPASGAFFPPGRFDIGQWYRPYNLEYSIPLNTEMFKIKENDHLFYMHLETDKKIKFKRYFMTKKLENLNKELANSPKHYGAFKPLIERYRFAKNANVREHVLTEIKRNLIED